MHMHLVNNATRAGARSNWLIVILCHSLMHQHFFLSAQHNITYIRLWNCAPNQLYFNLSLTANNKNTINQISMEQFYQQFYLTPLMLCVPVIDA